jgi:hypothetical protein
MSSPVSPQITARVRLTAADSWHGAAPAPDQDVRTTLCIGGIGRGGFIARFSTPNGQDFILGKPIEVPVEFMSPDLALPHFQVGTHFIIWHGKDIGVGEVTALTGTSNKSLERTREG